MHTGQTALLCKCFPFTPNQAVNKPGPFPAYPPDLLEGRAVLAQRWRTSRRASAAPRAGTA